jgi:hypothetical protein
VGFFCRSIPDSTKPNYAAGQRASRFLEADRSFALFHFTTGTSLCNLPAMCKTTTCGLSLLIAVLLTACATSVTNLTATRQPRNPNNQYLVEYQWNNNQQALRPDSITPTVIVGFDSYAMRQTPKMTNRWEAFIPVPPDKKAIDYHFKVDYEYNQFGSKRGKGSVLSPEYKLVITE